jgi:hypothetical protein
MKISLEEALFVPAPLQNLEVNLHKPNKFIGTLSAAAMQSLQSNFGACDYKILASFNCCGMQLDREYNLGKRTIGSSRFEFESQKIELKLEFLRKLLCKQELEVWRDDSLGSINWIKERIERLLWMKKIYVDEAIFNVCSVCENLISLDAAKATRCFSCGGDSFVKDWRVGLFVDFPSKKYELVKNKIVSPTNKSLQKAIFSMYNHLPDRVFINRRRQYGIDLAYLGIPDLAHDFLDPEVALSFMPSMVSNLYERKTVIQIQSLRTVLRAIPFISLFNEGDFSDKYFLTQYVSDISSEQIREQLPESFYARYLPLFLSSRTTDIPESQIYQLAKEYTTSLAHYNRLRPSVEKFTILERTSSFTEQDALFFNIIKQDFIELNTRNAVLNLRKLLIKISQVQHGQTTSRDDMGKYYEDELNFRQLLDWLFNMA